MNEKFDLIIFDCDGVLVDSERLANQVFARVLKETCDLDFTQEQMFDTFVGHSQAQCLEKIELILGHPPPAEMAERYQHDIDQALARSVVAVTDIEKALQQITLPVCVASSGSYAKMDVTLGRTGLKPYFEPNIFSTSEVTRGKPHPDIYLHAAEQQGVSHPSRCLVIEDSPLGVTGGVAAGMTVFAYAELMPSHKLEAAGAHQIFTRMSDLPELITRF